MHTFSNEDNSKSHALHPIQNAGSLNNVMSLLSCLYMILKMIYNFFKMLFIFSHWIYNEDIEPC